MKKIATKTPFALITLLVIFALSSCQKASNPSPAAKNPAPSANWSRISTLPNEKIAALEVSGNLIYAASASAIVYQSADTGKTWSTSNVVSPGVLVTSMAIFNNRIFVGTYHNGIFMSADNGQTWINSGTAVSPVSSP